MARSGDHKTWGLMLWRASNIPAVIALVVMLAAGVFADSQNNILYQQSQRADVLARLNVIRARLEGNITANIQLVRGLISVIAAEPEMDNERFSALAANLFQQKSQLRSMAAAPNLIVTMVYPLEGNQRAIGLDYRTNADQREAALRAVQTGELVIAGPVELVQGGQGVIGRFPVSNIDDFGRPHSWGIVSAIIDVQKLYADSGVIDSGHGIELAILGRQTNAGEGNRFFGSADVVDGDPVTAEVLLPAGSWQIAAIPTGGWQLTAPNAFLLRLAMIAAGCLIVLPVLVSGRLFAERRLNVQQLRDRETQLARLSRRLGLALDTSKVGVWELDVASGELHWDDRMNELYGAPADGGMRGYQDWHKALHPDDVERAASEFRTAVESEGRYYSEYRVVSPQGQVRNIRAIGAVYEDPDAPARIVGVNWDVSADVALNEDLRRAKRQAEARNAELEVAKASIEYNALHDSLTGLPNRRYLDQLLTQRAAQCQREGGNISLLHIDLDRFKQINDTLGHAAGDAMLIHASQVLLDKVRSDDFVARIGGDEFVVVCVASGAPLDLSNLAERIITTMREPVRYQGHECRFGVSVGIASETGDAINPKRLLINADIALYRAKRRGRNRYEFFSDDLQAEIVNTKKVADDILSGLEREEFVAFYQPQFDARSLDLIGVEALVRWQHPARGLLAPDQFLAIAEDLNVLATIDRLILEQALELQRGFARAGLLLPRVSVNVSSRRLHDEGLIESLRGLDIEPGKVSFELVESIYLDESDEIVGSNIEQIKSLGIDIEIDDFGTGYASIVSLLQLKPKRLKIDRQLVAPIVSSPSQRHLVESIIEIGQSLGIVVIAEGVETMEHARLLKQIKCDILQGYAFAKPMSALDLKAFVRRGDWRQAG